MPTTSIAASRKWDAYEAGKEVAENVLKNLDNDPKFFLLFSTIHYKNYGGFEKLLKGVWNVLPEETSLVGGTVPGFITPQGCFGRGAVGLACSLEMDVACGYGMHTKRNPKGAAKQCIKMVEDKLKNSSYRNRILFNLVSGTKVFKIPGYGYRKILKSKLISDFTLEVFSSFQKLIERGFGREDQIFELMGKTLPSYNMLLVASSDDMRGLDNFQFFQDKVLTNSIVSLGIATDLDADTCTTHEMKKSEIKFQITKVSKDGYIIKEINHKPAVDELYRILGWPQDFITEKNIENRMLYYPLLIKKGEREYPVVMCGIINKYIVTPAVVDEGEACVLEMSGAGLLESVKKNLSSFNILPEFALSSICVTILQTLGHNISKIKDVMKDYLSCPFIGIFSTGEGTSSPNRGFHYANMSYNTLVVGKSKI